MRTEPSLITSSYLKWEVKNYSGVVNAVPEKEVCVGGGRRYCDQGGS